LTNTSAGVYQPSSTSSGNSYTASNYNHLASSASSLLALQTGTVSLNQTTMNLALAFASQRQKDADAEVLDLALDELDAGNTAKARQIAQDLLEEDGQDVAAAHILGSAYLAEGDYDQAEKYFARAAMLAPSSERFASDLENVKLLKKSDDEVLEAAARLVADPERQVDGIRLLAHLSDRSPGNARAHMMLGDALMNQGWAGPAVSAYRNALVAAEEADMDVLVGRFRDLAKKAPQAAVTHSLLGQGLQKQGRFADALTELKWAAQIMPTNQSYKQAVGWVLGDMGNEALEEGRAADAIRHYEEAIELDSSADTLKSGLSRAHLEMSKWWQSRGLDDKAFTELSTAKQLLPSADEDLTKDLAQAFHLMGSQYRHAGELDWAISSFKRAYDLDPSNFDYRTNLARTYDAKGTERFDAGEYEQAETQYQLAVDLFPGNENYQARLQAAQDAQEE